MASRSWPRPATSTGPALRPRPPPDVLVLDLNMPERLEPRGDPRHPRGVPGHEIVVLTMQDEPAYARQALGAGALGYVLKEAADADWSRPSAGPRPATPISTRGWARGSRPSRRPAARRALRARGRGAAHHRAGPHQRGDRRAAPPLGPHGRDPSGAHPAEAAASAPRRAGALRARAPARRRPERTSAAALPHAGDRIRNSPYWSVCEAVAVYGCPVDGRRTGSALDGGDLQPQPSGAHVHWHFFRLSVVERGRDRG